MQVQAQAHGQGLQRHLAGKITEIIESSNPLWCKRKVTPVPGLKIEVKHFNIWVSI
jgi:hypothetical protein